MIAFSNQDWAVTRQQKRLAVSNIDDGLIILFVTGNPLRDGIKMTEFRRLLRRSPSLRRRVAVMRKFVHQRYTRLCNDLQNGLSAR